MSTNQSTSFFTKYGDVLAYASILLSVIVFFADALFGGKNFMSGGDNVAFYSFVPYLEQAKDAGEFPLWVPYIFGGMPSLASFLAAGDRTWDFVGQFIFSFPRAMGDLFNNDTARLALWYVMYGWGVYTLARVKGLHRLIGVFSAIAAIFSTFVIVWIMIGHSTKPVSMATLPWILLALERLREKFSVGNLFLLTLPLIVLVSATHPQMMFYIGCGTAIYMLVELTTRLITKEGWTDVLKAGAGLVLATVIALGSHADMFLATREYTPESTRGSAPLVQSEKNAQDQTGGNDYEYATNWSFSPGEMFTFVVPNYYGFGNTSIKTSRSAPPQRGNLYWGQMPFTDAANYMGVAVLVLGLIGMWHYRRDPFVIFLTVVGAFSLLLSFGKNFPVLYDIFYNAVPAFNKFRAPSMALCLLQFALPVAAGYGLSAVAAWASESTPQSRRRGLIILGIVAVMSAVIFLVATDEADYKEAVNAALVAKQGGDPNAAVSEQFLDIVYNEMHADAMAAVFYLLATGGLIFAATRGLLKANVVFMLVLTMTIVDLWRVDKRPYEPKEGSPEMNVFAKNDVVSFLQNDRGPYRVCDLSNAFPANWWAYHFIESVSGYSSAKLRVYQDMLDVAAPGPGQRPAPGNSAVLNPYLWNLLNVKYIVSDRPIYQGIEPVFRSNETQLMVYANEGVLPRAWFVDSIAVQSDRRTMLEQLRDGAFDARRKAVVEESFSGMNACGTDSMSTAQVVDRSNQKLTIKATTSTKQFLVVSEIFYDEWHAYIDGNEVPMVKTNFLLRGLVVPQGTHTVEFRYQSPAFERGRTISLASNIAAALLGLGALALWVVQRQKGRQAA